MSVAESNRLRITHGASKTKLYKAWKNIKNRCTNPKDADYPAYGGRGITLCSSWFDFAVFKADMGPRPSSAHSVERVDNNKGYCKANCRWATPKEQGRNRSNNRLVTYNGVTKCIAEWAELKGLKYETLKGRLDQYKWPVERALNTPVIAFKDCHKFRRKP